MKGGEMLAHVVEWAKKNDDVRAVVLVGSRAAGAVCDELSDIDLALFVTDPDRYAADSRWLSDIGEVWVCQKNTAAGEFGMVPVHYRLTIFAPGTRVDFSLYSLAMLRSLVTSDPPAGANLYTLGYRVLLDKDGATAEMAAPFTTPLTYTPPSEDAFRTTTDDFWHEAHNVAKYLARGDLWSVKFRDGEMKRHLLSMLEWDAHVKNGWDYDTGTCGKRMPDWIDSDIWDSLHRTYARFDDADGWDALRATVAVFGDLARAVATGLGYPYPASEDGHMGTLIEQMQRDAGA